jgi:hypothetical protein
MNFINAYLRRGYRRNDNATKPAVIEGAKKYLEYVEMRTEPTSTMVSNWITLPRNELTNEEKATKAASARLLNAWLLGDIKIQFQRNEQIPPRASMALLFLEQSIGGSNGGASAGCCSTGLQDTRELDADERVLKSTSLELLKNWFNGEIELEAETPSKRFTYKKTENKPKSKKQPA